MNGTIRTGKLPRLHDAFLEQATYGYQLHSGEADLSSSTSKVSGAASARPVRRGVCGKPIKRTEWGEMRGRGGINMEVTRVQALAGE